MIHDDVLVKAENVSKKFCRNLKRSLRYGVQDLGRELLGRNRDDQLRKEEFWTLQDVSFDVKRGECLGVIGSNGAGKTTLLRLLHGLIKLDKGRITMRGRVQALILLGAGFSPILTGRENIYIYAAVLGVPKREANKRLDEIIDFAEIGDFINAPVLSYSAGMKVRLGFSVASILMQPDILLIDEVLAVGDFKFRNKCTEAILRLKSSGAAFVFVSHNIGWISRLSDKVAYLKNGKVEYLGEPADAIMYYMGDSPAPGEKFLHLAGSEHYVQLHDCKVLDQNGVQVDTVTTGQPLRLHLVFDAKQHMEEPTFLIMLQLRDQQVLAATITETHRDGGSRRSYSPGRHALVVDVQSFPLLSGQYDLKLAITGPTPLIKYGRIENIGSIRVVTKLNQVASIAVQHGFVQIDSTWTPVSDGQS